MSPRPPRSVMTLTEEIIADRSPSDLPILSVVTQAYYDVPAVRRKMAATVQAWHRRQSPTALGAGRGSLTVQLTLVLMNGVAAGSFDAATAQSGRPVGDWLARRRLWWRLRRLRAPLGADTPVPPVPAGSVEQIVVHARRLAGRCGLTGPDAATFVDRLARTLGAGAH